MRKKKSYMQSDAIIEEGIIDTIISLLKGGQIKKAFKLAKKRPEIKKQIDTLNKNQKDLEKSFEDQFGVPVKLSKYKLSDFF